MSIACQFRHARPDVSPVLVVAAAAVLAYAGEWLRRLRERRRGAEGAPELDPRSRRLVALTQWPVVVLALVVAALTPALDLPAGARRWALAGGLALMLGGSALRWWAIVALGHHFTGNVSIQVRHRVVRDGPYRWLRHPAYAGRCALLTGIGLGTGNVLALLIAAALPLPALVWRIRAEEAVLSAAFPDQYPAYARRTSRLVPFLW